MKESFKSGCSTVIEEKPGSFGELVFQENLRRIRRQTPQYRLDMLCAALRDAKERGMIPKRNRAEHEIRLLKWIQQKSSTP